MADQLLSIASIHRSLPQCYIRPLPEWPRFDEVVRDDKIPTIDLGSPDRQRIVAQVAEACRVYGSFQVVNHGVEWELMERVMSVAAEFFRLTPEEKAKYYLDDPAKTVRLSTSSNIRKETVRNWRDYLRLHCHPLEQFVPAWPSNPSSFKEVVSRYCREVRELGFRLLRLILLGLELEEEHMQKVLGEQQQEQHMAINYYPKCQEPEITYGLPAHTDPNALTILLQDPTVAGLQLFKDGKWIAVNPQANALVVNIGDQLQDLTLGIRRNSRVVQGEAQVDVVSRVPPPLPEQIREHMFDKVVTPSDVGKLNRLVIPKRHAEKHFPLDAETNDKDLLLTFEDCTGKPWRFRYSYQGSRQMYVITQGWRRFVKEKGLGAGDTVSFARGAGEATRHRLYIDYKRRRPTRDPPKMLLPTPWAGREQLFFYKFPAAGAPPEVGTRQVVDAGNGVIIPKVLNSVPLVHGQAGVKRVKLFGVNLP